MKNLCLVLLLFLSACVQQQQVFESSPGHNGDLNTWLETQLSPYLIDKLAQDPRFHDQSVILVRLQGEEITAEIDLLTRQIRQQIMQSLLSVPGIKLPWHSFNPDYRHHRRLSNLQCRQSTETDYYIGVEISSMLSGRHRVSIRALDKSEKQWLSGFGMSWQGKLGADELAALSRLSVDESLRGLRTLPFSTQQTDMAADYLANNISCLLQQLDEDELLIHVQAKPRQPAYLNNLLKLVANNLSRYHEVHITDQQTDKGYLLTLEALKVKNGLDQVWTAISHRSSKIRLAGMDTYTYIQQEMAGRTAKIRIKNNRQSSPWLGNLHLSRPTDSSLCPDEKSACRTLTLDTKHVNDLFLLQYQAPGRLGYAHPASCNTRIESLGTNSRRYQIPVQLQTGETTLYAIVMNQHNQRLISKHLSKLPRSCEGSTRKLQPTELKQWLARLDQIMQQPNISWSATRTSY